MQRARHQSRLWRQQFGADEQEEIALQRPLGARAVIVRAGWVKQDDHVTATFGGKRSSEGFETVEAGQLPLQTAFTSAWFDTFLAIVMCPG